MTKSEADIQNQQFQEYLAKRLLHVTNDILVAVSKQGETLNDMSTKIDGNTTELTQKLDVFLDKQEKVKCSATLLIQIWYYKLVSNAKCDDGGNGHALIG